MLYAKFNEAHLSDLIAVTGPIISDAIQIDFSVLEILQMTSKNNKETVPCS